MSSEEHHNLNKILNKYSERICEDSNRILNAVEEAGGNEVTIKNNDITIFITKGTHPEQRLPGLSLN